MKETEAAYIDLAVKNIRELIVDRSKWRQETIRWSSYETKAARRAYKTACERYDSINKQIEAALIEMRK